MVKFSRYILVIIAVIAFAIVLPKFYWMAFEKPIRAPYIRYSCIDNDFMIIRSNDGVKYTNSKGEIFTREEYETKLPFFYTRQLLLNETMPDSINGVEMDMHEVWLQMGNRNTRQILNQPYRWERVK